MARVFIDESTLTAIGDAIRAKTGNTDLIPPGDMPAEIHGIETGGGGEVEEYFSDSDLAITGDLGMYGNLSGPIWSRIISMDGERITFNNIDYGSYLFNGLGDGIDLSVLNPIHYTDNANGSQAFYGTCASRLPKLTGGFYDIGNIFTDAKYLECLPDMSELDFSNLHTNGGCWVVGFVNNCHSLRQVPEDVLKRIWNYPDEGNEEFSIYRDTFYHCYNLDEVVGLAVLPCSFHNANMFESTFTECHRLAKVNFDINDDGTAKTANWSNQTIDLSDAVGYAKYPSNVLNYGVSTGITESFRVVDDASYQALKDEPDWWTSDISYSRYNHDSAVETINSLPDTSAYVAENGGTNTIKFEGAAGSATDGGAINTLTEEEIAVATAKGWTVSLA